MKLPPCTIFAEVLAAVIHDIQKMNPESSALLVCAILLSGLGVWGLVHFMRKAGAGDTAGPGAQEFGNQRSQPAEIANAEALIMGDPEQPLVEIAPTQLESTSQPIEASPAIKHALQPLLQHAPEMFRIS